MNGMRVGDKILHVMVQQNNRPGSSGGPAPAASLLPTAAPAVSMPMIFPQHPALPQSPGDWQHILPPVPGTSPMW